MKHLIRFLIMTGLISTLIACSDKADPDKASASAETLPAPDVVKPATPEITIPEGTKLHVALIDGLSTTQNRPSDSFTATLAAPVVIDGNTVLETNTKVKGRVTDVSKSGRVKGRASIRLVLTEVVHNGKDVQISTRPFVAVAQATKKRDAAIIGGGTGIGALIGGLAGGGKGAVIGAALGAGGSTGTVLATKGKDLRYPPETKMSFTLAKAIVF